MTKGIGIVFQAKTDPSVIQSSGVVQEQLVGIEDTLKRVEAGGQDLATGLVKDFLDSERAAGKSAAEIERVLVESYNVPKDAARAMSRATVQDLEDVQRATQKTSTTSKELGTAIDKAGKEASDSLDGVKGKTTDVSSGLRDLGGAAKDALNGDLGSAAAGGLDALTGLAAAVPGVGALIGTVFAEVGKGLVEMWQQRAQESQDRIKEMYQDFAKSGSEYLSSEYITSAADAILGDPAKYAEAQTLAQNTGLELKTVIEGLAGATDARSTLESTIIQKMEQQRDLAAEQRGDKGYLLNDHDAIASSLQDQLNKLVAGNGERDEALLKGQLLYGVQQDTTAEVGNTNKKLAETPATVSTRLVVDDSDLTSKLSKSQTVRVAIEGYARNGVRVI